MSDRIDDRDGSASGLFAWLVERERGQASSLVPRLPTMFEAAPAGGDPETLADDVVAPPRPATRGQAPVADVTTEPDRPAPAPVEGDPVRHRHEVVHVERQVLFESHEASTPGDGTVDSPRPPRPESSTSEGRLSRSVESWPSPDGDARTFDPSEPRRSLRPADGGPPVRPVLTERAVSAPESPDNRGDRDPRGLPVVATRREVVVPRPEPDRASPALPPSAEPVVRVSIGRLEIRAVPDPAPPRTRRPERRTQSLDDYLERRNQGDRS